MNMNTRTISVLIPAYNASKYIDDCVLSILKQSFYDFEMVIIDDNSSDGTYKKLLGYQRIDPRVRVFKNDINLGIAGNRNKAVSLSKGKYIVWQDADDIALENRLSTLFNYMEANPDIGICGSSIEIFDERGGGSIRSYPLTDSEIRRALYRYSPIAQPSAIVRSDILKRVGLYDLKYPPAEDLDMTFRIGMLSRLANVGEVLLRYRENPSSATFTKQRRMEICTLAIRNKYKDSKYYNFSVGDLVFNLLHKVSLYVIPSSLKHSIFSMIRDKPLSKIKMINTCEDKK